MYKKTEKMRASDFFVHQMQGIAHDNRIVEISKGGNLMEWLSRMNKAMDYKNLHGVMPISARETGISLKTYPKMTFSISIEGVAEMNS